MGTQDKKIIDMKCGRKHSIFLSNAREVFTLGSNIMSQVSNLHRPRYISSLSGKGIIKINSGPSYFVALSETGKVWIWGSEKQFQCKEEPELISSLSNVIATNIWCGEKHLAVIYFNFSSETSNFEFD